MRDTDQRANWMSKKRNKREVCSMIRTYGQRTERLVCI